MNQKQFENLKRGDLVRHKMSGSAYVVEREGPGCLAIRSVLVTNHQEWNLVDVDGRILDAPEERMFTLDQVAQVLGRSTVTKMYIPDVTLALKGLP